MKPIPDKAEVALEYPDKFYLGTFERTAHSMLIWTPTVFRYDLNAPETLRIASQFIFTCTMNCLPLSCRSWPARFRRCPPALLSIATFSPRS